MLPERALKAEQNKEIVLWNGRRYRIIHHRKRGQEPIFLIQGLGINPLHNGVIEVDADALMEVKN